MGRKTLFSVIYVDTDVKSSTILPVILQQGCITNTEHNQPVLNWSGFWRDCSLGSGFEIAHKRKLQTTTVWEIN